MRKTDQSTLICVLEPLRLSVERQGCLAPVLAIARGVGAHRVEQTPASNSRVGATPTPFRRMHSYSPLRLKHSTVSHPSPHHPITSLLIPPSDTCAQVLLCSVSKLRSTSSVHRGTRGLSAHPCSIDMCTAFPHLRYTWRALYCGALYRACH